MLTALSAISLRFPDEIQAAPVNHMHTTAAVSYIYEADTGNITELGNRYRDKIERDFMQKGYKVKVRRDIVIIMEDLETFGTGNYEAEFWEKAGAEVVVCGSYTVIKSLKPDIKDRIEVNVKAVRRSDASLEEAYAINENLNYGWKNLAKKIHGNIHTENFEKTVAKDSKTCPELSASLDRDPAIYIPGEKATLFIKSEKNTHVYIFNIAADNSVTLIYPNMLMPDQALQSNTLVFPPERLAHRVKMELHPLVAGESCQESFKIIASKNKMDFSFLPVPVNRIYKGAQAGDIRQVNKALDKYKEFNTALVHYRVN